VTLGIKDGILAYHLMKAEDNSRSLTAYAVFHRHVGENEYVLEKEARTGLDPV